MNKFIWLNVCSTVYTLQPNPWSNVSTRFLYSQVNGNMYADQSVCAVHIISPSLSLHPYKLIAQHTFQMNAERMPKWKRTSHFVAVGFVSFLFFLLQIHLRLSVRNHNNNNSNKNAHRELNKTIYINKSKPTAITKRVYAHHGPYIFQMAWLLFKTSKTFLLNE